MDEPRPVEPATPVLEIRGLRKRYGTVEALSHLDLTVRRGEVYGFLGRNGAGKSTTLRIVMGISRPDGGTLQLFGQMAGPRSVDLRRRIGYVAQEQTFYGWMTPLTLGRFVRGFYPSWDDALYRQLIDRLDLPAGRKVRGFSGGMKVKLALALALSHRPELLVLDEPTAGLDPVARREFLEMVRDQATQSGRTTLFSTHLVDEIEAAADRIGIVDGGRLRFEGTRQALVAGIRRIRHPWRPGEPPPPLPQPLAVLPGSQPPYRLLQNRARDDEWQLVVEGPADLLAQLHAAPGFWRVEALPLEEAFIEMVRKSPQLAQPSPASFVAPSQTLPSQSPPSQVASFQPESSPLLSSKTAPSQPTPSQPVRSHPLPSQPAPTQPLPTADRWTTAPGTSPGDPPPGDPPTGTPSG